MSCSLRLCCLDKVMSTRTGFACRTQLGCAISEGLRKRLICLLRIEVFAAEKLIRTSLENKISQNMPRFKQCRRLRWTLSTQGMHMYGEIGERFNTLRKDPV